MHISCFGFFFWNIVSYYVLTHFCLVYVYSVRQFIGRFCGMCVGCEPNLQIIL